VRRVTAVTLGLAYLMACQSWKQVAPDPYIPLKHPQQVRVLTRSGAQIELFSPFLRHDSLVGRASPPPLSPVAVQPEEIGLPLADVVRVEVQRTSVGKTLLLVGAAGVTLIAVIASATNESSPPPPDSLRSCPLVYSWDGTNWRLDSGTFAEAITRGLIRTDVDNLDYALSQHGKIRLRIANELAETEYVDRLAVLAVEHDADADVAPDAAGQIHTIEQLTLPVAARDYRGDDALERIQARDGWSWESVPSDRDPAVDSDIRDGLELVFPKPPSAANGRLIIDASNTAWAAHLNWEFVQAHGAETAAWYDSLDANPKAAREMLSAIGREAFLTVQVNGENGWEPRGMMWGVGPEIIKREVVPLDLSRVSGDSLRLRLESAPSFWLIDQVAIEYSAERPITVHTVSAASASDQHDRDRLAELAMSDDLYYVMEPGDYAELVFEVPDPAPGRAMSFLLESTGWYRIHTPGVGEPDRATLDRIRTEPLAVSRIATAKLIQALAALERSGE
jgi:hypothetical protein